MALHTMVVNISYPGAGGPGVNTWHLRNTSDDEGPFSEVNGLAQLIKTFYTNLRPLFTEQTKFTFSGVTTFTTDPGRQLNEADPWEVTGQASQSILLPAAAQIVVGWTTEEASRSGKGRTFLGPLGSGSLDNASDGTPSQGTVTLCLNAATGLVSSSTGFTNGAVGVWSPTDNVFRDFTGARVRKTYAVLTSRRD